MPTVCPRRTYSPVLTPTLARYESETLNPATGSIVSVLIPATDPAKVTLPEAGALTCAPTMAA